MKKFLSLFLILIFIFGLSMFATNFVFAEGIVVPPDTGLPDPGDPPGYTNAGPVLAVIFEFTNWILAVFMIMAVISFTVSGILYLFAFGDTYKAENAKRAVTYSIIAVAVAGAGLIIIRTINYILA